MITLLVLLSFTVTTLLLRRNSSQKKSKSVIKVSERAWIINNKFIDLDNNNLTPEQDFNNSRLDFEIAEARRYNERVQLENKRKIKEWEVFLKANPTHPFKACPGLDMSMPKRVIGIRYVK